MLNDPTGTQDSFREFRDPVASFVKLIATIDPRRHRATQPRHKPLSAACNGDGGATHFVSLVLSKPPQVLCEVVKSLDVSGVHEQRLAWSTLSKNYVMLSELYVQVLNLGMFGGRMHHDRRAVDEIDGLDEQTIYPKSMLLGDEQITARRVRAESALRNTAGRTPSGCLLSVDRRYTRRPIQVIGFASPLKVVSRSPIRRSSIFCSPSGVSKRVPRKKQAMRQMAVAH
jgi:hypothetical protein